MCIRDSTCITEIVRDGKLIYQRRPQNNVDDFHWDLWNIEGILDYADHTDLAEIRSILRCV